MNDKETTIPELINLLKTVEPSLVKEGKTVMLVNSSSSKKGSKNKKKRKITKQKGGLARKGQGDILKRYMLPLWQRRPLEEKLQGLHGVKEEGGM